MDDQRPRLSAFITMALGVILLFWLVSQIGRYQLTPAKAIPAPTAPTADSQLTDTALQRGRALARIGATPIDSDLSALAANSGKPQFNQVTLPTTNPTPRAVNTTANGGGAVPPAPEKILTSITPAPTSTPTPMAPTTPISGGNPSAERCYQVRNGDTLYRIAQKVYGNGNDWEKIRNANHLNGAAISAGQKLIIP